MRACHSGKLPKKALGYPMKITLGVSNVSFTHVSDLADMLRTIPGTATDAEKQTKLEKDAKEAFEILCKPNNTITVDDQARFGELMKAYPPNTLTRAQATLVDPLQNADPLNPAAPHTTHTIFDPITLTHLAALYNHAFAFAPLREAGADMEEKLIFRTYHEEGLPYEAWRLFDRPLDTSYYTPLQLAIECQSYKAAETLCTAGADIATWFASLSASESEHILKTLCQADQAGLFGRLMQSRITHMGFNWREKTDLTDSISWFNIAENYRSAPCYDAAIRVAQEKHELTDNGIESILSRGLKLAGEHFAIHQDNAELAPMSNLVALADSDPAWNMGWNLWGCMKHPERGIYTVTYAMDSYEDMTRRTYDANTQTTESFYEWLQKGDHNLRAKTVGEITQHYAHTQARWSGVAALLQEAARSNPPNVGALKKISDDDIRKASQFGKLHELFGAPVWQQSPEAACYGLELIERLPDYVQARLLVEHDVLMQFVPPEMRVGQIHPNGRLHTTHQSDRGAT